MGCEGASGVVPRYLSSRMYAYVICHVLYVPRQEGKNTACAVGLILRGSLVTTAGEGVW